MQTLEYKINNKPLKIKFYTDPEELPYHRYFLAVKLAILHNETSSEVENIESDISSANKLLAVKDIDKAKFFLLKITNRISMMKNDLRLDLASIFPFVHSVNDKVLQIELTIDDCIDYAKEYATAIPIAALKKKVKF